MVEQDLRLGIKAQLVSLEGLLNYLEDRDQLGAKEYLYCQARIEDTLKQLKQLEWFTEKQQRNS